MRIAIASSGLGHVARGIETWAEDTARALHGQGVPVTLFQSGDGCGADVEQMDNPLQIVNVPCLRRNDPAARRLSRVMPGWTWRWGFCRAYGWEQWSFWRGLSRLMRAGGYDVLHVQDPMLAWWSQRAYRRGVSNTRVILAHGTEETAAFLASFDHVQHLAPWHAENVARHVTPRDGWCTIPNFVDTDRFRPAGSPREKAECRESLGLPPDGMLIGCVAAVKKDHKRIDYLIKEFADCDVRRDACLVIVGAAQRDTPELAALAARIGGGRVRLMTDLPRERMPSLYRALDLFVLSSLFEMMPIAVLEALASGTPMLLNTHPVLRWMCGDDGTECGAPGGRCVDMAAAGALGRALGNVPDEWLRIIGVGARARCERMFSKDGVVAQYVDYYQRVCARAE